MAGAIPQYSPGQSIGQGYQVEKKLGEGGFGAVYKVTKFGQQYALKVEGVNEPIQVLKMEVSVLEKLTEKGRNRHFCRIEDKGRDQYINFVVMTLVGPSLQDLRKQGAGQKLTMGCALAVGVQTLEALEDLHSIGYLHRDVKPGNYAVGRAELNEQRKVYVLDFGMCRSFISPRTGTKRTPREAAGFRGTVRYAPISCHMSRELCEKDDLETWLYMQIELTKANLPWKNEEDMNKVGEWKQRCRSATGEKELCGGCPREYLDMLRYIDSIKYWDTPDYRRVYDLLRSAMRSTGTSESAPFDWERGGGGGRPW